MNLGVRGLSLVVHGLSLDVRVNLGVRGLSLVVHGLSLDVRVNLRMRGLSLVVRGLSPGADASQPILPQCPDIQLASKAPPLSSVGARGGCSPRIRSARRENASFRLLLRQAMQRAKSPHEIDGMNPDDLAIGK